MLVLVLVLVLVVGVVVGGAWCREGRAGSLGGGGAAAIPPDTPPTTKNGCFLFLVERGAALAPADPYTINIPRPRAPPL